MPGFHRTGVAPRVRPLVLVALVALGAFTILAVRGATAQPPLAGNGAARFDDLRELNNKLTRVIAKVEATPEGGIDFTQLGRTIKDLEATKLRAVDQFPPVFGLPYAATFIKLSCIDERFSESQLVLAMLEQGLIGRRFPKLVAHRLILRLLQQAKRCKDTLEIDIGRATGVPSGVSDDLRELNNKLTRVIAKVEATPEGGIDFRQLGRTVKDLEVTKLRAVDQFPEILDSPYGKTFRNLSCIDERFSESQLVLAMLEQDLIGRRFPKLVAHRLILRLLQQAKRCKDTLEVELMHSFNLKPSEQASVGVIPTTPNGTDTQNPNKLNAPKPLKHAYVRDGFVGRHERDYVTSGVNGTNPESWPPGRNVLFFDVFDLFGSAAGAQKAAGASIQNLKSEGFTPVQDSSLGPGESVFQLQAAGSPLLSTIIYVQRGTFIMKIAGACNGCQPRSIEHSLMAEAQTQLNQAVLMGFPGPAPAAPSGSLSNGSGTILNYSVQTNTASNAFELILPAGDYVTGVSMPPGFSCSDSGNIESCTGKVTPNTPLSGSFDHTGTIAANCGCVQVAFSQDGGTHWSSPATLSGPPASSPPPTPAFSCTGTRSSSDSYTWTVNITCNQPFSYLQLAGGSFNDRTTGTTYDCPLYWNGQPSNTSNTITFSTTTSPAPANAATQFRAMWDIGFTESALRATASPNSNGTGAVQVTFTN